MIEATTVSPGSAADSGPGLIARIGGVIFSPRETFAAVAMRPQWVGVMAVTLTVVAASTYVTLSSPELQDAMIDQQIRGMAARGATISDAQVAGIERFFGFLPAIYAGAILVLGPLFSAAIAGIFVGIFSTLMGGTGTFRQVYAVLAHAGVVSTLQAVFSAAMILAGVPPSGARPPGANLGIFVPMLEETSFVTVMLSTIDLFLVWWVVTLSIGLGVLYKRRTGPIASVLIGLYVVLAVVVALVTSGS